MRKLRLSILIIMIAGCSNQVDQATEDKEEKIVEEIEEIIESNEEFYKLDNNKEVIKEIKKKDDEINEKFYEDTYTYDNPFVVVNPYGNSPLSAYVLFTTDEPTQITYTVEGKTKDTEYSYTTKKYSVRHEIPLMGLYAGQVNNVKLEVENENGEVLTHDLAVETEDIDSDFYTAEITQKNELKINDGLTYMKPSSGELFGVDNAGDIRFLLTNESSEIFNYNEETGHFILNTVSETEEDTKLFNDLIEIDPVGRIYKAYTYSQSHYDGEKPIHNDIITLNNGNILMLVHNNKDDYIKDAMIEVDWDNGKVLNVVNFKEILPESFYKYTESKDWLSQSSVSQTEDDTLIVSFLNQNIIAEIKYPEIEFNWIIANEDEWPKEDDGLGEKIIESSDEIPISPYDIEVLPDQDDNASTLDILVYDGYLYENEAYNRIVQYRINRSEENLEEITSYHNMLQKNYLSDSSVHLSYDKASDNVLVPFTLENEESTESKIIELNREKNEKISEVYVQGINELRGPIDGIYRLPLLSEDYVVEVLRDEEE
ncbi:aryl-sulfate sulfotransferase [Nosocomiicoccus ampullae]|uniref:Arylsulfate sulfotransferase n=1 Tax=Nosocomiicoccus ampullae TaxID=489910 RepID=A0A9Q2CXS1_9STAP|nr:aryl-sulfate sulfotransferase [Nosocomiicoccus ampullae]MBB5175519.1 arylsulfate sulfotransferase [Nosocomiicoccus ampullae]QYA46924.1 aryl-sulfate sulfotransferase [Nosocomiicoccus ampullae]